MISFTLINLKIIGQGFCNSDYKKNFKLFVGCGEVVINNAYIRKALFAYL